MKFRFNNARDRELNWKLKSYNNKRACSIPFHILTAYQQYPLLYLFFVSVYVLLPSDIRVVNTTSNSKLSGSDWSPP